MKAAALHQYWIVGILPILTTALGRIVAGHRLGGFGAPKAFGRHRCTAERSVEDNVGESDAEHPGPASGRILLSRGVRCKEQCRIGFQPVSCGLA